MSRYKKEDLGGKRVSIGYSADAEIWKTIKAIANSRDLTMSELLDEIVNNWMFSNLDQVNMVRKIIGLQPLKERQYKKIGG